MILDRNGRENRSAVRREHSDPGIRREARELLQSGAEPAEVEAILGCEGLNGTVGRQVIVASMEDDGTRDCAPKLDHLRTVFEDETPAETLDPEQELIRREEEADLEPEE